MTSFFLQCAVAWGSGTLGEAEGRGQEQVLPAPLPSDCTQNPSQAYTAGKDMWRVFSHLTSFPDPLFVVLRLSHPYNTYSQKSI